MYCCTWGFRNTIVWVFNCDLKFKVGIASRETTRLLTLRQFLGVKCVTSQSQAIFRRIYKQLYAGPEQAFHAAYLRTHSSHPCCHERSGWGAPKLTLPPGAGNPRYATAWPAEKCSVISKSARVPHLRNPGNNEWNNRRPRHEQNIQFFHSCQRTYKVL